MFTELNAQSDGADLVSNSAITHGRLNDCGLLMVAGSNMPAVVQGRFRFAAMHSYSFGSSQYTYWLQGIEV
jgi:hypothetical protein